ncbi:MAG: hypothetical protein RX318_04580 [bacterium]|nr:hypothetical protein [bacterium]
MDRGYIKLFRKLQGSPLWMLDPITFKAAIYLLLEANYKPKTEFIHNVGRNVEIKRGELITSYDSIASACGHRGKHNKIRPLTTRQARTTVDKLKSISFVTKVATERCLHLRIENYDAYQSWPTNATEETTEKMSDPRQTPDREQEGKNERSSTEEGYQPKYPTVLTILHGIEGWPTDPKKDNKLIHRNKEKHDLTIDQLEQAALELATWYDDNPGEIEKPKANSRMRFNTFARNRAKWDREGGLSDGASGDGQSHRIITAGHIRQEATPYLMRAAKGKMNFEEFEAAILKRYDGQSIDPEAIQGAWNLAQREFGESDGS